MVCLAFISPALAFNSGGAESSRVGGTARTIDEFNDFLGVCSHIGRTTQESVSNIVRMASYIRAKHIRSDLVSTTLQVDKMADIYAQTGIKFDGLFNDIATISYDAQKSAVLSNINAFSSVEGLNEIDLKTMNDVAFSGLQNYANYRAWQQRLYDDFHQYVDVFSFTWVEKDSLSANIETLTPVAADYHAIHYYYYWYPSDWPTNRYTRTKLARDQMMNGTRYVVTETNAYTIPKNGVTEETHLAVSDLVQAKLALNNIFVTWSDNVKRIFFYELVDRYDDPEGTDKESHFGLFYNDMTPKPSATAIQNLFSIIKGSGSGHYVVPNYSLSGMCGNCHVSEIQGQDAFWVILYQDTVLTDSGTRQDLIVSPVSVGVSFESSYRVSIYDPLTSNTATSIQNTSSLNVDVPDHVVVLKIERP